MGRGRQGRAGTTGSVLSQLARHTQALIPAADKVVVFLCDEDDPDTVVAVAGEGVPGDLIGRRFGADEGMVGQVLGAGKPLLVHEYHALDKPIRHRATRDLCAGGAAPIVVHDEVRGALSAGTTNPERRFGRREREMLSEAAALGGIALEHAAMGEQLERSLYGAVEAMATAVDMRDDYTARHSHSVVALARAVGRRLSLGRGAVHELELAALLHDVGKIAIPDSILRKPGPLDRDEWTVVHRHPALGAELLARIPGLERVADLVRFEHERWDGNGYPEGLRGNAIPRGSRIIFACDAYHAMTSNRPYRKALGRTTAVAELKRGAGTQFCPETVRALLAILTERSRPRRARSRTPRRGRRRAAAAG